MSNWTHFVGVDPGFEGGIAVISRSGSTARCWDMPITGGGKGEDRKRQIDLNGLREVFRWLRMLPQPYMMIEWPTTRPGEGAERSLRFGRGQGYLEAFAFLLNFAYTKVAPATWKQRMGLPGKFDDPGSSQGKARWGSLYPQHAGLVLGAKGGLKDGRLDAFLIAEYARAGDASPVGYKGGRRPPVFRGAVV